MRHTYLYIALLICSITNLGAQQRLTLDECREMAIENSHKLNSAEEQVLAAEDMLSAYKTNRLPNLSFTANYLYSTASFQRSIEGGYLPTFVPDPSTGEFKPNIVGTAPDGSPIFGEYAYMPNIDIDVEINSVFNAGALLAQPIYMGGKISNAIKLARVGVSVSQLKKELGQSEILIEVDKAFYTTLKVEEALTAATKYKEVVEEFHRQISAAVGVGMATRNDLMKVEVRLNEAKLMHQKAENGLRLSKMNLCYNVGLPLTTKDLELEDNFEGDEASPSRELDITSRPEYAMLQKQIEAKELEAKITRSDMLPSLSAVATAGYANGVKINGSTLLNTPTLAGGVMLNVPVFHWGEGRRKTSAAKRNITIARNEFEDLSQRMTLELMQAINTYDESIVEVELMERSVEQAEENMRLSENQYRAGMETIADYLEAQAMWQGAMSKLVEAKAAQRVSYSEYKKASGRK